MTSPFDPSWSAILEVERLVPGGRSLARLADGRVALLDRGLPRDVVHAIVEKDHGSYVTGRVRELVKPSPDRIEPACPIAERCGGCPLMALPLAVQASAKEDIFRQALQRTGRFDAVALDRVETIRQPSAPLGYRSRLRLQVHGGALGFFRKASHDFVEVEGCLVATPELDELLRQLRARLVEAPACESLEWVELRVLSGQAKKVERSSLVLKLRPHPNLVEQARWMRSSFADLGALRFLWPPAVELPVELTVFQRYFIDDETYCLVPPGAFTQVNERTNRALVASVLEEARKIADRLQSEDEALQFVDLYGGAGNFSLPLLRRGYRGALVEVTEVSVGAARRAAEEQGLVGGEFIAGDVPRVLKRLVRRGRRVDLAIVDPPRAGAREALEGLFALAPSWIVMVSCDPVTLARDLKELVDKGYVIESIRPFEMFPQTHHLESLTVLRRQESAGAEELSGRNSR